MDGGVIEKEQYIRPVSIIYIGRRGGGGVSEGNSLDTILDFLIYGKTLGDRPKALELSTVSPDSYLKAPFSCVQICIFMDLRTCIQWLPPNRTTGQS